MECHFYATNPGLGEMELVLAFFAWLYSFKFRHGEMDRISWSPSRRGQFEVKLFYKKLYSPYH